jgi:pyruvate kinase
MDRRTKIVATIGPASQDEQTLLSLLKAGMNVARLNFSHGSHEDHALLISRLRDISHQWGQPLTILQDLQGPKIRTGALAKENVVLAPGQRLTLTTSPVPGNENLISIDFPGLPDYVKPGNRILLDDGNLELKVIDVRGNQIEAQVVVGGSLKEHKGVNLPGVHLDLPSLTPKDEEDLAFGLQQGVDVIALSFVRSAKDIHVVRQKIAHLAPEKSHLPIIAKLERAEALDNLEEIVQAADGVMVARGDLGVEMSPEAVPIAQKRIIECANRHAKIVITATQMLDSMIHHPRPTRAEASDVANAIFDGTDAVMLSGETAVGEYPLQSVQTMDAIIRQAEAHLGEWGRCQVQNLPSSTEDDAYYVTLAARELAHDRNVAAIAAFTKSGRTALLMSKARPRVPILAFTPDRQTYQWMGLFWGVQPHLVEHSNTLEEMIHVVESSMIATTSIQPGQQVVVICGFPVSASRPTNLALLHTVGSAHT